MLTATASRSMILDCKFYGDALTSYHGGVRLHSGNLYQLMAYLKNQAVLPGWESVEGILLYPAVSHAFDHRYTLLGHRVRVVSVDLDQAWHVIRAQLLDLLAEPQTALSGNQLSTMPAEDSPAFTVR